MIRWLSALFFGGTPPSYTPPDPRDVNEYIARHTRNEIERLTRVHNRAIEDGDSRHAIELAARIISLRRELREVETD